MAPKLGTRIARAVTNALRARDRAEMHAMDILLSVVESPHRQRRHTKAPQLKSRRRVTGGSPATPQKRSH
jgi:hypothetical protein